MEQVSSSSVEYIRQGEQILAIIIRSQFSEKGIRFFTPDEFSQQLGYMNHPAGKKIEPHFHNEVHRNVIFTQEVLYIKRGKIKVNFYSEQKNFLFDRVLQSGDVILLAGGGHGFEVLEDIEMIEIKQGPYQGDSDKTRFDPLS
jgi:hypothetical protein